MGIMLVTARLAAPIAARQPVQLDALVLAAHPDCAASPISRATPASEIIEPGISIHRLHALGEHCYLTTEWILPPTARRSVEHVVKRKDGEDLDALTRPWNPGLGPGKNRCIPMPLVLTDRVSWIAVGQGHGLRCLLRRIHHVGSLRGQGYGIVQGWTVEPLDVDPVRVLVTADGHAARHLPAVWAESGTVLDAGAWLPPYWHPCRLGQRVRAGTPVVLRREVIEAVARCR
jgi:hypothetical protein